MDHVLYFLIVLICKYWAKKYFSSKKSFRPIEKEEKTPPDLIGIKEDSGEFRKKEKTIIREYNLNITIQVFPPSFRISVAQERDAD